MPYLAPSRRADPPHLTGGKAGEVIVVHEALAFFQSQPVEHLLLAGRAQRGDGQDLCLAAGEQAGAVGARQQPDLAGDGPYLGNAAPADALALFDDGGPHLVLDLEVDGGDYVLGRVFIGVAGRNILNKVMQSLLANVFVPFVQDFIQADVDDISQYGDDLGLRLVRGQRQLGLADGLPDLLL